MAKAMARNDDMGDDDDDGGGGGDDDDDERNVTMVERLLIRVRVGMDTGTRNEYG